MNIVAINGSPKGKKSNTAVMIDTIMESFHNENCIHLVLGEMDIKNCTGCYTCWTKTPGICFIKDDMAQGIEALRTADLFILGSPLYFNNISGTLKNFIDRLTALGGNPHQAKEQKREKVKIIMMSNCGFPVRKQFDVVSLWIKHFTNMLNGELVGEFYTTNGKMLTSENEEDKKKADGYKAYLRACGKSIYETGRVNDELRTKLEANVDQF